MEQTIFWDAARLGAEAQQNSVYPRPGYFELRGCSTRQTLCVKSETRSQRARSEKRWPKTPQDRSFWPIFGVSAREGTRAESAGSVPNPPTHSARQCRPESLGPSRLAERLGKKGNEPEFCGRVTQHGSLTGLRGDRFQTDFTPISHQPPQKNNLVRGWCPVGPRLVRVWSESGVWSDFRPISDRSHTDLTPISHQSHTDFTPAGRLGENSRPISDRFQTNLTPISHRPQKHTLGHGEATGPEGFF